MNKKIKDFLKSQMEFRITVVLGMILFFFFGIFISYGELSLDPLYRTYEKLKFNDEVSWDTSNSVLIEDTFDYLNNYHLYRDEIDNDDLLFKTAQFLADHSTKDPYTVVKNTDKTGIIGMTIDNNSETYPRIYHIIPGMEADKSGLKEGMLIESVDGVDARGIPVSTVVDMIKGDIDTTVQIKVLDSDNIFEVKRQEFDESSKIDINGSIGRLYFPVFSEKALESLKEEVTSKSGDIKSIDKLIIDLRNNIGGNIAVLKSLVSLFVPEGSLVIKQMNNDEEVKVLTDDYFDPIFDNKEICVLTSKITASSSEAFILDLKNYEKTYVKGEKTYGKYLITQHVPLSKNNVLEMVTHYWESPQRIVLDNGGIDPDQSLPEWCQE